MKIPKLDSIMVSISDFKKELSDIINRQVTKVIIKNNMPVSVIMPYSEYEALLENSEEGKKRLIGIGQDITLNNGVKVMVAVEKEADSLLTDDGIAITTYVKMKTSGNYKKHYTLNLPAPRREETLTNDELAKLYREGDNYLVRWYDAELQKEDSEVIFALSKEDAEQIVSEGNKFAEDIHATLEAPGCIDVKSE